MGLGPFDLTVFNYDSIFFAVLTGVIGCFLLWRAARHATLSVVLVAVDAGTLAKRPLPEAVARGLAAYRLE